jgi:hypothetical protein
MPLAREWQLDGRLPDRMTLEHLRPPLPQGVDERGGVRSADAEGGDDREEGRTEPDQGELTERQRVLPNQRQHASDHRTHLGGPPVQEGAGLVPPPFGDDVDQRLPPRRGHSFEPRSHGEPERNERDEAGLHQHDREGTGVKHGKDDHHRGRPEPPEEPVGGEY